MIDAGIAGDAPDPAGNFCRSLEIIDVFKNFKKNFLAKFFAIGGVVDHAEYDGRHQALVFFDENAEGLAVSGLNAADQQTDLINGFIHLFARRLEIEPYYLLHLYYSKHSEQMEVAKK